MNEVCWKCIHLCHHLELDESKDKTMCEAPDREGDTPVQANEECSYYKPWPKDWINSNEHS